MRAYMMNTAVAMKSALHHQKAKVSVAKSAPRVS